MMDEDLRKKIAVNEALFREANEAIERGLWPGDDDRVVRFRCECARLECNEAVELTVAQYEAVRSNPRRFVVLDDHQHPEAEVVVERAAGLVVIEKIDGAAAVAEERDPRS